MNNVDIHRSENVSRKVGFSIGMDTCLNEKTARKESKARCFIKKWLSRNGNVSRIGNDGSDNRTYLSRGTPASMSFKLTTPFVGAKNIWNEKHAIDSSPKRYRGANRVKYVYHTRH